MTDPTPEQVRAALEWLEARTGLSVTAGLALTLARRGAEMERVNGYLDRDGNQWVWSDPLDCWCSHDGTDSLCHLAAVRKEHGPLRPLYAGPVEDNDVE